MRFFIDTAEFDEIKEAYDFGFIDGVTTNPSLIVKAKRDLKQVILKLQTLLMDLLAQRLFPLMLKAWWRKHMTL